MKLGPVTKRDKENTGTSKKLDDDAMLANFDVIVFSPIYGRFAAIRKPNSRCMIYKKLTFSLTVTFYLTKPENRTKKSLTQLSYYCFGSKG